MVNKGVIGGRVSSKEMYQLVLREACNPCRKRFVAHHYMRKQKYDSDSHRHRIGITVKRHMYETVGQIILCCKAMLTMAKLLHIFH